MISNNMDFLVKRESEGFSLQVTFNNQTILFTAKKPEKDIGQTFAGYIKSAVLKGGCTDVQPINGVYQKRFIKNMFKGKHVSDLNNQLKYLNNHEENKFVKVFVLDIKDTKCHYDNIEEIKKAEKEVEDFFSGKEPKERSPRKDIYKLMSQNDINYFFCEGRFKHDIITDILTPEQSTYFQSNDEARGVFCQIAEMLLNGFKMGYQINCLSSDNKETILCADNYLILFNNKEKLDIGKNPVTMSNLTLFTLYPGHYKELYSIKEKYCESLSSAFKVEHKYDDETHTTAIKLEF